MKKLIYIFLLIVSLGIQAQVTAKPEVNEWDQKIDYSTSYEARHKAQQINEITNAALDTFGILVAVIGSYFSIRGIWNWFIRKMKKIFGSDDE